MYGRQELVELGQRVAEDGPNRHERALLELAFRVQSHAPGAAAVLADRRAPSVLRERALSVAADHLFRTRTERFATADGQLEAQVDAHVDAARLELRQVRLDWEGQLVGWGA